MNTEKVCAEPVKIEGSTDWMNEIRFKTDKKGLELEPYPLQFANCVRIERNDALYIFDEVGAGKTVSAGLMAIHYLCNHPGQDVLVITTPALAAEGKDGKSGYRYPLFLHDWYEMLGLEKLGLTKRVVVINNDQANIGGNGPNGSGPLSNYGMIIIDEAHMFLNQGIKRYENLTNRYQEFTCTEKVVFLTATPIKDNWDNLKIYQDIAAALLRRPITFYQDFERSPEERANQAEQQKKFLALTRGRGFDPTFPATRYFKDTVNSLTGLGPRGIISPNRKALIWNWGDKKSKIQALQERICAISRQEGNLTNRFVIYVRLVDDEAYMLRDELKKVLPEEDIQVITGENSSDLRDYAVCQEEADGKGLARVLIITWQIAEAGINLPAYNYVVNYHIPSSPASLEQRFGRIDRLNSGHKTIHACYLLDETLQSRLLEREELYANQRVPAGCSLPDSSTYNFCCAIGTYLTGLLPYLPSRNALLTPEVIEAYKRVLKKWLDRSSEGGTDSSRFNGKLKKNLLELPKLENLIEFPVLDLPEASDEGQNCVYFRSANTSAGPNAEDEPSFEVVEITDITQGISKDAAYQRFYIQTFSPLISSAKKHAAEQAAADRAAADHKEPIDQRLRLQIQETVAKRRAYANQKLWEWVRREYSDADLVRLKVTLYRTQMAEQIQEGVDSFARNFIETHNSCYRFDELRQIPEPLPMEIIQIVEQYADHYRSLCGLSPEQGFDNNTAKNFFRWAQKAGIDGVTLSSEVISRFAELDSFFGCKKGAGFACYRLERTVCSTLLAFQPMSCIGGDGIDFVERAQQREDQVLRFWPDMDLNSHLQFSAFLHKRAFRAAVMDWFNPMLKWCQRYRGPANNKYWEEIRKITDFCTTLTENYEKYFDEC